jgi:hypothetical protein
MPRKRRAGFVRTRHAPLSPGLEHYLAIGCYMSPADGGLDVFGLARRAMDASSFAEDQVEIRALWEEYGAEITRCHPTSTFAERLLDGIEYDETDNQVCREHGHRTWAVTLEPQGESKNGC